MFNLTKCYRLKLGANILVVSSALLLLAACGDAPSPPTVASTSTPLPTNPPASTSTPLPLPTHTPVPQSPFDLVPFAFTATDTGDGWKNASVKIATLNKTSSVLRPHKVDFIKNGMVVETQEGKSYPVKLVFRGGDYPDYDYGTGSTLPYFFGLMNIERYYTGNISKIEPLDTGGLPPGLPIAELSTEWRDITGVPYTLEFRFAAAAHPQRIVLPTSEYSFELSLESSSATSETLQPIGLANAGSLEDLAKELRGRYPSLTFDFLSCTYRGEVADGIQYKVTNSNALDEVRVEPSRGFWSKSGEYLYQGNDVKRGDKPIIVVGPGQTKSSTLLYDLPAYFVLYNSDESAASVFKLDCPSR